MFKKNKIKKNVEFQEIIHKRKQIVNNFLILYFVSKKQKNIRFGICVPKKTGNAVLRNKIKRQITNIIDHLPINYNLQYDLVLIVRKPFINLSFIKKTEKIKKIFSSWETRIKATISK